MERSKHYCYLLLVNISASVDASIGRWNSIPSTFFENRLAIFIFLMSIPVFLYGFLTVFSQ